MRVKGLAWLGIPAGDYAAAVRFFGETLGLEVAFDSGNTVELAAGNGDRIQLLRPGHRYFGFYRSHGARTVPLLEVDVLDQASAELAGGGAELLGGPESDGTWTWPTFRVPEGNIRSLGARMALVERARYAEADVHPEGRRCINIYIDRLRVDHNLAANDAKSAK